MRILWLIHHRDGRGARTAHAYRQGSGPLVSACGRPVPALTLHALSTQTRCRTCEHLTENEAVS
jgi:hypothetical protein